MNKIKNEINIIICLYRKMTNSIKLTNNEETTIYVGCHNGNVYFFIL